jgi:hypothetical protein
MAAIGGAFMAWFWYRFTSHPLVPVSDPGLKTSMKFINI